MDAVKFIEERKRLCGTYEICKDCPANRNPGCLFNLNYGDDADEQVSFLEEWSAAHPLINRQMKFLSYFPNADIDDDGILKVCPRAVEGKSYIKSETCGSLPCAVCRKTYWSVIER